VTERALPLADGASACPFVAFEDDRDERSSVPDHRHRCYAEAPPAPRALAHQEAYCLSTAFPVCPTFQDWARREAARARGGSATGAAGAAGVATRGHEPDDGSPDDRSPDDGSPDDRSPDDGSPHDGSPDEARVAAAGGTAALAATTAAAADDDRGDDLDGDPEDVEREPDAVRRNPPRDWAAPPPWLASSERGARPGDEAEPPPFLGRRAEPGQGLAGSAADRLAGGPPPSRHPGDDDGDEPWAAGAAMAAGAAAGAAATGAAGRSPAASAPSVSRDAEPDDGEPDGDDAPRRPTKRPRAYAQHLGGTDGPDWERPRRSEAYPTIRSRVAMPQVPRLAVMAGAVAILAIALFLLPSILGLGGTAGGPAGSGSPAASEAAQSLAPTPIPAPTPVVYTLKKGDTLSKIAARNGLTLDELLAANPAIKNPNKVAEGQQIIIPVPSGAPPADVGGSASPSSGP
jgi:LysM domain